MAEAIESCTSGDSIAGSERSVGRLGSSSASSLHVCAIRFTWVSSSNTEYLRKVRAVVYAPRGSCSSTAFELLAYSVAGCPLRASEAQKRTATFWDAATLFIVLVGLPM